MKTSNMVWIVGLGAVAYYLYTKSASAQAAGILQPINPNAMLMMPTPASLNPTYTAGGATGSW